MITAVDSSVVIDILAQTSDGPRSEAAVQRAMNSGQLVACDVVWAEVAAWFPAPEDQAKLLSDMGVAFSAVESAAAHLAGKAWRSYRLSGGKRTRLVGDFLIAAHAQLHADRLLTRDRGFFRNYFPDLEIVEPSG